MVGLIYYMALIENGEPVSLGEVIEGYRMACNDMHILYDRVVKMRKNQKKFLQTHTPQDLLGAQVCADIVDKTLEKIREEFNFK